MTTVYCWQNEGSVEMERLRKFFLVCSAILVIVLPTCFFEIDSKTAST